MSRLEEIIYAEFGWFENEFGTVIITLNIKQTILELKKSYQSKFTCSIGISYFVFTQIDSKSAVDSTVYVKTDSKLYIHQVQSKSVSLCVWGVGNIWGTPCNASEDLWEPLVYSFKIRQ